MTPNAFSAVNYPPVAKNQQRSCPKPTEIDSYMVK
jgi:hypothetical protein